MPGAPVFVARDEVHKNRSVVVRGNYGDVDSYSGNQVAFLQVERTSAWLARSPPGGAANWAHGTEEEVGGGIQKQLHAG